MDNETATPTHSPESREKDKKRRKSLGDQLKEEQAHRERFQKELDELKVRVDKIEGRLQAQTAPAPKIADGTNG